MELFIFARFHARPGNEGAVAQAMLDNLAPTREEPGCLEHSRVSVDSRPAALLHSFALER